MVFHVSNIRKRKQFLYSRITRGKDRPKSFKPSELFIAFKCFRRDFQQFSKNYDLETTASFMNRKKRS